MNSFRWILASIVLGLFSPVIAAQSDNIIVSHYEPLQRLSVQSTNPEISQKFGSSGPVTLSFDALGQSFDLRLEPNRGFLSAASRTALPEGIGIYRGSLAGNAESSAFTTVIGVLSYVANYNGEDANYFPAVGTCVMLTVISP